MLIGTLAAICVWFVWPMRAFVAGDLRQWLAGRAWPKAESRSA